MRNNRIAVVLSITCVFGLGLVAATSADAQTELLINGSFEDPALDHGEWIEGNPPGWTFHRGVWNGYGDPGDNDPYDAYDGENVARFSSNAGTDAVLNQIVPLAEPIAAGQVYTLSAQVLGGGGLDMWLGWGDESEPWMGWLDANRPVIPDDGQYHPVELILDTDTNPGAIGYSQFIVEMASPADAAEPWFAIDAASLTIPEPSSFVLAVLGLLGLAAFGLRRRA